MMDLKQNLKVEDCFSWGRRTQSQTREVVQTHIKIPAAKKYLRETVKARGTEGLAVEGLFLVQLRGAFPCMVESRACPGTGKGNQEQGKDA